MGLSDQNRKDLIHMYWTKSIQTMEELQVAVDAKKWNMAANRMYYALFHAITALFVKDGHPVGTHRGAKAAFGQYYVLTGKMTPDEGRFFSQMETLRDRADYDIVFTASEKDILSYLPDAKSLIGKIGIILEEPQESKAQD